MGGNRLGNHLFDALVIATTGVFSLLGLLLLFTSVLGGVCLWGVAAVIYYSTKSPSHSWLARTLTGPFRNGAILVLLATSVVFTVQSSNRTNRLEDEQAALQDETDRKNLVKHFLANRDSILEAVASEIANSRFESAIEIVDGYAGVEDASLSELRAQSLKAIADITLKARTRNILARLKDLPSSDYAANLSLYQELARYEPANTKYRKKVQHYSRKLAKANSVVVAGKTYFVTRKTRVRLGPSASSKVTGEAYRQERVEVREVKKGWARVSRFYDGQVEGVSGQVARWVSVQHLSSREPSDLAQPFVRLDSRVTGIPKVGDHGLTKRDVLVLHAAARYFIENGDADKVVLGDKSVSRKGVFYLNFGGASNRFFRPRDIPNLERRMRSIDR